MIPVEITNYIEYVRSGEYPTCKEQRLLVDLVEKIVSEEELLFDFNRIEKAHRYIRYFPFDLFEWEWFVFVLHNCTFKPDGRPRFRDLFLKVGRGNGKNGYLSFEAFWQISDGNGISNYNVDICAMSEDQSKTSFDDVWNILENQDDPKLALKLRKHFKWNKVVIENLDTHSKLQYRTNNPKSKDGMRPGSLFFDEVHQYEDWSNINVFTGGLGKKPHPRRTYATTDGDVRDGVLDKLTAQAIEILTGKADDKGMLPFICKLDDASEVDDKTMWHKANPSLRYFPDLQDEMDQEYEEWKLDPQVNTAFMTKRMNLPQGRTDIEVTSWERIMAASREPPDLYGMPCVCGVDFAKTTDMVAAVLVFYDGENYYVKHHSWFCARSNDRKVIKAPLEEWAERGILTIVNDMEVAATTVTDWITEQRKSYKVRKVCIDNYRISLMSAAMKKAGFLYKEKTLFLVRPSNIMKVQPLINSAFATGRIAWGDDPMMRWYTNNTKLVPAPNNNWTFGKIEPHSRKTDGFMAFVAAMTQEEELHQAEAVPVMAPFIIA